MKRITLSIVVFLAVQMAFSQVVVLNYMSVPPGGHEKFIASEIKVQKVMQKRVDDGDMLGWEVYRVLNQGSDSKYQFVTVDIYEDISSSLKGMNMAIIRDVYGDQADQLVNDIMSSRELIYRETLGHNFGVGNDEGEKFLLISFMKASNPEKYFKMEYEAFRPIHQVAIDRGDMTGWSVWTPRLFDETTEYTAVTVNGYSSLDQMGRTNYGAWFDEYAKGKSEKELKDINMLADHSGSIRTIIRAQVWEKLASTEPAE